MNWLSTSIIYQIFIDRFAGCSTEINANTFLGGNIVAATEKLNYIADLGCNTIWLSPFYTCSAYHGYHITNFNEVDSHFGSHNDLCNFLEKAHNLNIKVLADFVPNHCSSQHPFFIDACKTINSPYRNWFIFEKWPTHYRKFLNYSELPKFNIENSEVQAYLLNSAKKWIETGFDGLRVDHAIGLSFSFLQQLRQQVKKTNANAILIGEVWAEGIPASLFNTLEIKRKEFRAKYGITQEDLQLDYDNIFDGVFDFHLRNKLLEFANAKTQESKYQIVNAIHTHLSLYSPTYCPIGFLDNHDTDRFLYLCRNNKKTFCEAAELLFSLPIPIAIYNGTERGISQKHKLNAKTPFSDLEVRQPIDWNTETNMIHFFKNLISNKTFDF
jgi:glycosidase